MGVTKRGLFGLVFIFFILLMLILGIGRSRLQAQGSDFQGYPQASIPPAAPSPELAPSEGSALSEELGNNWNTKTPMPTTREGVAAAIIGSTVFLIDGYDGIDTNLNEAYDVSNDKWSPKTSAPTSRSELGAVSDGQFVYVLGGRSETVLGTVEKYDPNNDVPGKIPWATLPSMPTPRAGLGVAIVGNTIYAIGGRDCTVPLCGTPLDVNEAYDIAAQTWTTKTSMPTPRMDIYSTAVVDGKIYVIGGYNADLGGYLNVVEIYDPETDTWSSAAPMPTSRSNADAIPCGTDIVVVGGVNDSGLLSTVEVYDTLTNLWTAGVPMPTARAELGVVSAFEPNSPFQQYIFAIGGGFFGGIQGEGANEALSCLQQSAHQQKVRPAPGGVSISNIKDSCTAGTFGNLVKDNKGIYILSNNHVLARTNEASIGESIVQPGTLDDGFLGFCLFPNFGNTIASLTAFQPIDFSANANNIMDAAIARVLPFVATRVTPEILGIGLPKKTPLDPQVGMEVVKSGRTTGFTEGWIMKTNIPMDIGPYPNGKFAHFKHLIWIKNHGAQFKLAGDSGSLILTAGDHQPIGLVVAGDDIDTFANPIKPILKRFKVGIVGFPK